MGMKEPKARKGNEASKGNHRTDTTPKALQDHQRNHPQLGATGASQQARPAEGRKRKAAK